MSAAGISPVSIDVTTADVQVAGWCAVRVVAPGPCPNTPAAFPALGAARLADVEADVDGPASAPIRFLDLEEAGLSDN